MYQWRPRLRRGQRGSAHQGPVAGITGQVHSSGKPALALQSEIALFNSSSQTSLGSKITDGGNVSLKSTEGDLRIVQCDIKAGDMLSLDSAGNLILEAVQSVGSSNAWHQCCFEVDFGAHIGAQGDAYAYVQASAGSHNSNAQSTTCEYPAGREDVLITFKGVTTLRDAVVAADRISKSGVVQSIFKLTQFFKGTRCPW